MRTRSVLPAVVVVGAILMSGCDDRKTAEQLVALTQAQKEISGKLSEQSLRIADLETETKRLRRQVADLEEKVRAAGPSNR